MNKKKLVETGKWEGFFDSFSVKNTVLIQKEFIETILKHTDKNDLLMEVASGSGYTSIVLFHSGRKKIICSDIEDELLKDISIREPRIKVEKIDSFNMKLNKKIDCIFHQGFLEHFNNEDIIKLLKEQGENSKKVIFDVPNARRWNRNKEYGNERFLYHSQWRKLIKKSGLIIVDESARKMPRVFDFLPGFLSKNKWVRKYFGTSSIFVCKQKI